MRWCTDETRLFKSVRPSVASTSTSSVLVQFTSGPSLSQLPFVVKCVEPGGECIDPSSGSPTTGMLPRRPSLVNATVTDLAANATYDCWVAIDFPGGLKCLGPLQAETSMPVGTAAVGGSVGFFLKYNGISMATYQSDIFGYQRQFCANLLTVQPGGSCQINRVRPGSIEVDGTVTYSDFNLASALSSRLKDPNDTIKALLIVGVVNSTSLLADTAASEPTEVSPDPVPGAATFVMVQGFFTSIAHFSWLDGKSGAPVEKYEVLCTDPTSSSCTQSIQAKSDAVERGANAASVSSLEASTKYACWVKSFNSAGDRCSPPVMLTTVGKPSDIAIANKSLTETSVGISWKDSVAAGDPVETYSGK